MNFINKISGAIKTNEAVGNVLGQALGAGLVGIGSLVIQKWVAKSQIKNIETQTRVLEMDAKRRFGPDWDKPETEHTEKDSKTETEKEE